MSSQPEEIQRTAKPRADGVLMHPRALWSYAHIALYSGYAYNYIVNDLSAREDFPKAVRPTPTSQPRFRAGEVMAYFERHEG